MYSNIALKIYSLLINGKIKSNYDFWKNYSNENLIKSIDIDTRFYEEKIKSLNINLVCCFDEFFPILPDNIIYLKSLFY